VPDHLYEVNFISVIDKDEDPARTAELVRREEALTERDAEARHLPHELRESRYCWCDSRALAAFNRGLLGRFFVVEIRFRRWDPLDPRNAPLLASPSAPDVPPVFAAEDGHAYMRMAGGTMVVSLDDIGQMATERIASEHSRQGCVEPGHA